MSLGKHESMPHPALIRQFGSVVRSLREQQRWSQESLALRAEINRSFLGEIERGDAVPSLTTMEKLSHALQLPLSHLLLQCENAQAPHSPPPSPS